MLGPTLGLIWGERTSCAECNQKEKHDHAGPHHDARVSCSPAVHCRSFIGAVSVQRSSEVGSFVGSQATKNFSIYLSEVSGIKAEDHLNIIVKDERITDLVTMSFEVTY